jgi:hypothetical protein
MEERFAPLPECRNLYAAIQLRECRGLLCTDARLRFQEDNSNEGVRIRLVVRSIDIRISIFLIEELLCAMQ